MRVLLVTDAWYPQVNGVVRTLTKVRDHLNSSGHEVVVLGPEGATIGCPTYPEIRLTLNPSAHIRRLLSQWTPNAIHIATEGPLGWAMRAICLEQGWPFTTSFHTRFPEYIKARCYFPRRWTYRVLKSFHQRADQVLVPTQSVKQDLEKIGLRNIRLWGRGVDTDLFHPQKRRTLPFSGPVQLYVGRLATEKNLTAFLSLDTPGTKVVVGDGPDRANLERSFPQAVFLGARFGQELAEIYASADVFVFPSRTDTFGLVMLESLACGTPVAAFPTPGPLDVLTDDQVSTMSEDLESAIHRSLALDRKKARAFALKHSWETCAQVLLGALAPIRESLNLDAPVSTSPLLQTPISLYYSLSR